MIPKAINQITRYQKNKIAILTHVYSDKKKLAKEKIVSEKLSNIKIIVVSYHIDKNIIINSK